MKTIDIQNNKFLNMDLLVHQVIKLWTKLKKQVLEQFDLTCSQFEILSAIHYLTKAEKEIIQIDLSEKTGIDPMTTSTILRNLEKKGLITRKRGTENTRIVIVQLTSKGSALYMSAFLGINNINEKIYDKIDKENLSIQLLILSDELNKFNN